MRFRMVRAGLLALALPLAAAAGAGRPLAPEPVYAEAAKQLARVLPAAHILQAPLDEALSARAWTNYLNVIDFDHSYFLQSDVDAFAASRDRLGSDLRGGRVQFAYDVFAVYRRRVEERGAYVTNLLAGGFDFGADESYAWKRKDAPWPRDRAEQDELWRKRIKNEYLAYVVARELDAQRAANAAAAATNRAAAATNAPPAGATNAPAAVAPPPTPGEFVRNRYEQFRLVIEDADAEFVLNRFLSAVAGAYDPHSEYMSPARVEDFNIDMSLTLCGIGAQLRSEDGAARIEELIPGGPAARDARDIRLRPGDKIVGVGQGTGAVENVLHMPLSQTVRKIRGAKGTRVVLNVLAGGDGGGRTRLVDLVRDEVKLEEQAATGRVERVALGGGRERKLGVIRLPAFYGTMQQRPGTPGYRSAALDVMRALASLNAQDVEGLVLDLRNNGGGSLREAIDLTSAFVRSGPVVQVREVRDIHVLPVPDSNPAVAFRRPMVVLVNRISASASEIVAAALQDYGRAVIVGDPQTHGKGSVQTILPLGEEKRGQLKATSAMYYRITGLSTQLRGVRPDVAIPSVFDTLDLGEDRQPNALPWSRVPALDFTPAWDVGRWIPTLRQRSSDRLAKDPRYGRYCRLVQHVRDLNARTAVPLEKARRLQLAAAEAEVQKLESEETRAVETTTARDDVLLNEALRILSDLVELNGGAEMPWEEKGNLRLQMLRMFGIGT